MSRGAAALILVLLVPFARAAPTCVSGPCTCGAVLCTCAVGSECAITCDVSCDVTCSAGSRCTVNAASTDVFLVCTSAHCFVRGGTNSRMDALGGADAGLVLGVMGRLRCDQNSTCRGTLGDQASIECRGNSTCVLSAGADSVSIVRESASLQLDAGPRAVLTCSDLASCTGVLGDGARVGCLAATCNLSCAARCVAPSSAQLTCLTLAPVVCPGLSQGCGTCDLDAGFDGGMGAGTDAGPGDAGATDAGSDAGVDDGGVNDAGADDAGADDAGADDAGTDAGFDAGGKADAGPTDAGRSDAGAEADGGRTTPRELSVGCGCEPSGGIPLLLLALGALRLRRTRR